jgi:hypothetical protein
MTAILVPNLSLTLNQRRWACVLDPTLALSDYGLPLVKQLGELAELWIVRELWHILDNPQFYLNQPNLILGQPARTEPQQLARSQQVIRSLKEWERLRTTTDRTTWNVRFLADVMGESCVPTGIDPDLLWRWETLAQSLDTHLEQLSIRLDTLTLARRDLAALAVARPACILTHRSAEEVANHLPPAICTALSQWKIPCERVGVENAIVHLERDQFRTLLVQAGFAKFLWAGLNLTVLHLVVPAAATLASLRDWSDEYTFTEAESLDSPSEATAHLWQNAQGFWYSVT